MGQDTTQEPERTPENTRANFAEPPPPPTQTNNKAIEQDKKQQHFWHRGPRMAHNHIENETHAFPSGPEQRKDFYS